MKRGLNNMNTLTFVRDKEWIDQAKTYTYEALRFLGIRYQWHSKEHIQIDKDHVIKFIVEAYDPVYVVHCGVRVLKLDSTRKLRMFKGQREDNYNLEVSDLRNILSQFLELKYYNDMMGMTKLQYRDHRRRNLNESKKVIREAKSVIKTNKYLIEFYNKELNRTFLKDQDMSRLNRKERKE